MQATRRKKAAMKRELVQRNKMYADLREQWNEY
jgi:hypothetical protein